MMRTMLILMAALVPAMVVANEPPTAPCAGDAVAAGCANRHNLAAMASPADLEAGRPLAPAPARLEAAAIRRLEGDKVKELRRDGTGASGGSGSGAGGGR